MIARLRVSSLLLLLVLGSQARAAAQLTPARDPSGDWAGSAQLSSPCRGSNPCRLAGGMQPPSIRFHDVVLSGADVSGYVSIHVPSAPGCPGVDITRMPIQGSVSGTRISLAGAGLRFDLRQTTDLLQGMVEPLGGAGSLDVCGEVKLGNAPLAVEEPAASKASTETAGEAGKKSGAAASGGGGRKGAGPLLLLGGLAAAGAAVAIGASMAAQAQDLCTAKCSVGYRFCSNFGVEVCCPESAPSLCPDGRTCTTVTFPSCPGGGSAIVCCPGTTDCKSGC